jgi:uncharacterized repeat protein (TIGR03803 family)
LIGVSSLAATAAERIQSGTAVPRRLSHPDCRSVLTLIVARHDGLGRRDRSRTTERNLKVGTVLVTTLVSFNGTDGANPYAGLIADAAGDLFGTTLFGGPHGYGTVFEIAKTGSGYASTPTTLVRFDGTNGANPYAGLIADAAGDLFGTNYFGGLVNYGTVFELVNNGGGSYSRATESDAIQAKVLTED